jgi:dimeric dUTPase (all-alpha-NTP-PPase superfamily)
MKAKIKEMLVLQDEINRVVTEDWKQQGYPWYRAAMVESIEMLEHFGFKWWKKQTPDMAQVQLELVDIWHFMLSHYLEKSDSHDTLADLLTPSDHQTDYSDDLRELIDLFVGHLASEKNFDTDIFYKMLSVTGLSFDDLYLQYLGKNTLNRFRQHNGYKDGSYIKIWDGLEDNEVLFQILADINDSVSNTAEHIYNTLAIRYQTIS